MSDTKEYDLIYMNFKMGEKIHHSPNLKIGWGD